MRFPSSEVFHGVLQAGTCRTQALLLSHQVTRGEPQRNMYVTERQWIDRDRIPNETPWSDFELNVG